MCDAFGIVNFETANVNIKGLGDYRPVSAFSFLGRYRLVDFPISNMSNSGINHIKVLVKSNPRSLVEHLGTGRHYNINSKRGKLHILPAASLDDKDFYNTDVNALMYNLNAIEDISQKYVVLAPSHMVYRQDFSKLLDIHMESGADITMLYQNVDNAKEAFIDCDVVNLNKQKGLLSLERNRGNAKARAISLETYVLRKKLQIQVLYIGLEIS